MMPFDPGLIYLGWRCSLPRPDPGPPPRPPEPPRPERLDPGWVAAQRREERRLSRPARTAVAACLALTGAVILLGRAGRLNPALTLAGAAGFAVPAARDGWAIWRGRRELRTAIAAEERRIAAAWAAEQRRHARALADHTALFLLWQECGRAVERGAQWHPVAVPGAIERIDVAGGTLAGWSALLTMIGVTRLAAGGEVTVLDLSEGAVARDLVTLAPVLGIGPLVWLLPADLARFDLGAGLRAAGLADVLAATAAASRHPSGGHDPAADHAILARVLGILGDGAPVSAVLAGLRILGQIGDPRGDVSAGLLTAAQRERISTLFGRGAAERVVIERAWSLEARLRVLAPLGTDAADLPPSRVRVAAVVHGGDAFGAAVLGTYAAVSLTHLLQRARKGQPWRHTLILAAAERLPGDVLDRLTAACEATRTGLVLAYRSAPAHVRERLGRGNAALAVMRLGNADDAKVASEQIGTAHRFVISQFTDTVGASVSDTAGDSYTSTVGSSDSWSSSVSVSETTGRSRGRGQSRSGAAPFAPRTGSGSRETSESHGTSDSESITEGINESTSWGVSTSRALSASGSLARTVQRSREFLVEPHELQRLPASALIVSYASPAGRQVVLADANPAILTLPTVALRGATGRTAAAPGPRGGSGPGPGPRTDPEPRWDAEPWWGPEPRWDAEPRQGPEPWWGPEPRPGPGARSRRGRHRRSY